MEQVEHIKYTPDLRYSWDNGLALTTYLDGFKHGKIRGSKCHHCGRIMIPARSFCELCNLRSVQDYCDLPDTGTVQTFTLSHINWDSSPLPKGKVKIIAVIAIDGAAPEMGLCHILGEVDPKDVKWGMRVKAVWKPEKERTGTVTDILYFKPIKGKTPDPEVAWIKPVELDSETARAFPGKIPMSYIYTAGLGGIRFYADLAKGKLSGTRCPRCRKVFVPPTGFCEDCLCTLDPDKNAEPVDPRCGKIVSFTMVHEDRSGHLLENPAVLVQVAFPGAEGSVFGRLETKDPDAVCVGLAVELQKSGKNAGPEGVTFKVRGK